MWMDVSTITFRRSEPALMALHVASVAERRVGRASDEFLLAVWIAPKKDNRPRVVGRLFVDIAELLNHLARVTWSNIKHGPLGGLSSIAWCAFPGVSLLESALVTWLLGGRAVKAAKVNPEVLDAID